MNILGKLLARRKHLHYLGWMRPGIQQALTSLDVSDAVDDGVTLELEDILQGAVEEVTAETFEEDASQSQSISMAAWGRPTTWRRPGD